MTGGILGPLLASVIVIGVNNGKNGLKDFFGRILAWRRHYIWYIAAFGLPIIIWLIPTLIHVFLGGSRPILFDNTPYIPSSCTFLGIYNNTMLCIIIQFFTIFLANGVTEEPGWRGVALPLLQENYNAVKSSIMIGFLHSCWHLPLYFIPGTTKFFHQPEKLVIPFISFLIVTILFSFIYTWLYNSTESVFFPILTHTTWNLSIDLLRPPTAGYPVGYDVILILVELIVVLLLIFSFGSEKVKYKTDYPDIIEKQT
ncbi:MAG: CPBP family intramembrane glutamic endopeptidase [Promethearchaeota archaeon]